MTEPTDSQVQVIDLAPDQPLSIGSPLQAELVKTIALAYKKNLICNSCNLKNTIIGNGFANGHYRLKCTAKQPDGKTCGKTFKVADYVGLLHQYFKSLNPSVIPTLVVNHDGNKYKVRFLKETFQEVPAAGSDIDETDLQTLSEGDSMEIDEEIALGKRKLQDTSITIDSRRPLEEQLTQMNEAELRKVVKHFHERAVAAETKYDNLQAEVARQRHKADEQEERIRRLEELTQINNTSINNPILPALNPIARAPTDAPTFADIVLRNVPQDRHDEVLSARLALKAKRREIPPTSAPKTLAEAEHDLRMVYVDGIQRMRFTELKGHLKMLGFSLTKIRSISFVGRITEFIVFEDYFESFLYQVKTRLEATIVSDFDTTKKTSPSSTIDPKKACARRLKLISEREGTPFEIKKLIESFITEKNLQNEFSSVSINDDAAPPVGLEPTTEAPAHGLNADADATTHQ